MLFFLSSRGVTAQATVAKSAPATAMAGGDYTYTIGFSCPSTNNLAPCTPVVMTDVLPPGVTFLIGAPGVMFDQNSNTVTFDFGTVANGSTASVTFRVTVPEYTFDGVMIENTASITYSQGASTDVEIMSPPNTVTIDGAVSAIELEVVKENTFVILDPNQDYISGQQSIFYGHRSEDPIADFVLEDILPAGQILAGLLAIEPLSECAPPVPFTIEVRTNNGVWQTLGTDYFGLTGPFSSDQTYATPFSIDADELSTYFSLSGTTYPDGIRVTYPTLPGGGCVNPDFESSRGELLITSYNDPARTGEPIRSAGDIIENCATVSSSTGGFATEEDCANITFRDPTNIYSARKTNITADAPFEPLEVLTFELFWGSRGARTIEDITDPYVIDVLPPEFSFLGVTSAAWNRPQDVILNPGSTSIEPTFTTISDYQGVVGQTALIWSWDAATMNSITIPVSGSNIRYSVEYEVQVNGATGAGTYENSMAFLANDADGCFDNNGGTVQDVDDLDGDGDVTESYCAAFAEAEIIIPPGLAGLDSRKEVNGNLDAPGAYSRFPDNGEVSPGGEINYRFNLVNPFATTVEDIVLVDVLPHVGDRGVVANDETRDSEWRPVFTAQTLADLQAHVASITGAQLFFTTECFPCLNADLGAPVTDLAGCAAPAWSTTPPATLADVCGFKIEYGTDFDVETGESINFDITMESPANVPTGGEIAWNSFGFTGVANGVALLASEPIKVGIVSLPGGACVEPTATTGTTPATCDPDDGLLNDAEINLTAITNGDVVGISVADVNGDYAGPAYNADPTTDADLYDGSGGTLDITDLMPGTNYVVRVFNAADDCFEDFMVMTSEVGCNITQDPCACPTVPASLCWSDMNFVEPNGDPYPYSYTTTDVDGSGVDVTTTVFQRLRDNEDSYVAPGERCGCTFNDELAPYFDGCGEVFRNWKQGNLIPDTIIFSFSQPVRLPTYGFGGFRKDSPTSNNRAIAEIAFFDGPNATGNPVVSTLPNPGGIAQISTGAPLENAINILVDEGLQETELFNGIYYFQGLTASFLERGWTVLDLGEAEVHSIRLVQYTTSAAEPQDFSTNVINPGDNNSGYVSPLFFEVCDCNNSVSIGDTAFVDTNADGLQTMGEPGIGGVTATVYDNATGSPVTFDADGVAYDPVTMTDADGSYSFDNLPPGDYYVVFDISTATDAEFFGFTDPNVGGDDAIDSDAVELTPTTAQTTPTGLLAPGTNDPTLDVGLVCIVAVEVADGATLCSTQAIDLTDGASVTPSSLTATWSTPDGSISAFTTGTDFVTATTYVPTAEDRIRGSVTLVLTTDDPAGVCDPVSESVTFIILNVNCGTFFWDGSDN